MKRIIISLILGVIGVVLSGLYIGIPFAIIGLKFGISSLKSPAKKSSIPVGHQGKPGKLKVQTQPFITNKYISYASIVINISAIIWGLITLIGLIAYVFGVIE